MPLTKDQLGQIIEALLFVATEPVTVDRIKEVTGEERSLITEVLTEIQDQYGAHKGVQLVEIAGGYQLVTRPETGLWVKKFLSVKTSSRISKAGLETLAIIAYKQPVTRDDVEKIRGVDCLGVLKTLLERRVIKIIGRRTNSPGLPYLYGTTKEFLISFGLKNLSELPPLKDFPKEEGVQTEQSEKDHYLTVNAQNN